MIQYKVIEAPSYATSLESVLNTMHGDEGWVVAGVIPGHQAPGWSAVKTQIILQRERDENGEVDYHPWGER